MINKYFGINLEFNRSVINNAIIDNIIANKAGYICVVDSNVLTISQKNNFYKDIINNSLVNTCDGSSIALFAGLIHNKDFRVFNGPEIFNYYIEKPYKQLLLGSSDLAISKIKNILTSKGIENSNVYGLSLPFAEVNEFNYEQIASYINKLSPEIIWVSLGAPKQEFFMNRLKPHLNKGIMFGIGAAFNFYIGEIKSLKFKIGALNFIWVSRLISEPKKQLNRIVPFLVILPKILINEYYLKIIKK